MVLWRLGETKLKREGNQKTRLKACTQSHGPPSELPVLNHCPNETTKKHDTRRFGSKPGVCAAGTLRHGLPLGLANAVGTAPTPPMRQSFYTRTRFLDLALHSPSFSASLVLHRWFRRWHASRHAASHDDISSSPRTHKQKERKKKFCLHHVPDVAAHPQEQPCTKHTFDSGIPCDSRARDFRWTARAARASLAMEEEPKTSRPSGRRWSWFK
jgi:hypothetical protein